MHQAKENCIIEKNIIIKIESKKNQILISTYLISTLFFPLTDIYFPFSSNKPISVSDSLAELLEVSEAVSM